MKNEELRKTYNKIAKDWCNDDGKFNWWTEGIDTFLSLLSKGATILDVGCGSGYKTKYMFDKGYKVEGIDFSEEMIDFSTKKYKDINFKLLNVVDIDKLSKTFDGIFAQAVLMHFHKNDITKILEKIKEKINDKGLLYITVPEIRQNGIHEEIRLENDYGYDYERFFSYYRPEELRKYFKDLNMEIIYENIINTGRSSWINIIARK